MERFALQQAEHDFNLVQPTGRRRREVKLDSAVELRQPLAVSLVRGIVIQDDVVPGPAVAHPARHPGNPGSPPASLIR